jgi:hypothetical protein
MTMKFNIAVSNTPELAPHLLNRLDALSSAHQNSIVVANLKRITGSVDIDAALQSAYPHDNRWDYAIGYHISNQDDKAFFVEFHRAKVDEVDRVLKKKKWLEIWMHGKSVDNLSNRRFVWVSAGGINIPPNSSYQRNLNNHGIQLVRRLKLG